jgi:AcrR family transcriptional regulator
LNETVVTCNDRFMDQSSDRYSDLLARIVDSFLVTGVTDLSLRPLAERVETSARLLIYHFESKENLVARALEEVRLRVGTSLRARAAEERPTSLKALLLMFWDWALEEEHALYFRLLFEVDGLSMFDQIKSSSETRQASASVWLSMIDGAAVRLGSREQKGQGQSTLVMAAMTGLLQDYLSTGERARTTEALGILLTLIPDADHSMPVGEKA